MHIPIGVPASILSWTDFGGFHTVRDTVDTVTPRRLAMAGQVATQTVLEQAELLCSESA